MNKLIAILALGLFLASCGSEPAPEKVEVTEEGNTLSFYGAEMTTDGAISVEELVAKMNDTTMVEAKVMGTIKETCTKAGCWMKINMGQDDDMMVFLGDHDFFVPTSGADGLTCYIEGRAYYDTISVDWLQHLAEDAGKTAEEIALITEPEFKLAFNADGVIIDGYVAAEEATDSHEDEHSEEAHEEHEGHDSH